jgi:hypothetical protein
MVSSPGQNPSEMTWWLWASRVTRSPSIGMQANQTWLGEGLIGGGVLVHVGPGGRRPELGRRERVRRARHGLDDSGSARQVAATVCPVSCIYLRAINRCR